MLLKKLSSIRSVFVIILLGAGLGVYSPISAQDETPPPTEVPTLEPTFTEVPTLEPTATDIPPTAEPTVEPPTVEPTAETTVEPTLEPTVESPTLEPTAETTVEPTLAPTSDLVTATPESSEATEAVEPTVETTPEYVTATPELLVTEEVFETVAPVRTQRPTHVEASLLDFQTAIASGNVANVTAAAEALSLNVTSGGQLVHVEVLAIDAAEAARLRPIIEGLGGVFLIGYERRMEFNFPLNNLGQLEALSGDFTVIEPRESRPTLGSVTSEGVQVTGAAQWHTRGFNGLGVKVGVVDQGFTAYASAETAGCVRAASNFVPNITLNTRGDHGTNVAQIICDMAPKAEVYLAQAETVSSLNAAVDWLIAQNVNVINMSLRWDQNGVGDGTGEVNTIIQRAIDRGILWVNAAGNSNGDTYHATYSNIANPPGVPPKYTGQYHNFGSPYGGGAINPLFNGFQWDCDPGNYLDIDAILRYDDWNATRTGNATGDDYDLFLFQSTDGGVTWTQSVDIVFGFPVESSFIQGPNPAITPVESFSVPVACSDENTMFGLAVQRFASAGSNYIDLITWFSGNLAVHTDDTSISTPADSAAVLTVAAGEVKAHPDGWPFSPFGYPDLAVYSSRGPILGDGGTNPLSDPTPCSPNCKPDVTAPTNVLTSRDTAFNGTSAASPHAAGFAALVYQWGRAGYETFSGSARAAAIKTDVLALFTRSPGGSVYGFCNGSPQLCFGQGVLTIYPDWFSWTDMKLEHISGTIVRSGTGWLQQTQAGSSGGNYAYTTGTFAQIEFGVAFATGVNICLYQRPDLTGVSAEVRLNGNVIGAIPLYNATPTQICQLFTIVPTVQYHDYSLFTIRPIGGNGLTFDYIQVDQSVPTLQENQLDTFGTWRRTPLASSSGGFYSYNSQRGAGVQFYTNDPEFIINYTKRPTGGIMEVWVNGRQIPDGLLTCPEIFSPIHEINTFSGDPRLTSSQHICRVTNLNSVFTAPYLVQLVNSGRQTPATATRSFISIDNLRFPLGGGAINAPALVEVETGYTGQVTNSVLPMNGVWRNLPSALASGGRHFTTTTNGAELRFRTTGNRVVVYFTSTTTGALLDILVNGQLCTACGTIDTYRPGVMYKVPYVFEIPGTFTPPYHVTLRNSGRANPTVRSPIRTMTIDRVDVFGALDALRLFNVQGDSGGSFWINERWIMNRQTEAIGGDVFLNSSPYGAIFFNTESRNFTLLLGKNRDGGLVRVSIWNGASYDVLAEFNGQSTSTLWRYGLDVVVPPSYTGPLFNILVEVDSLTQFGNRLDYGYVDALLLNDNGALENFNWTLVGGRDEVYRNATGLDINLVEVGPGWGDIPANGLSEYAEVQHGQPARRTSGNGASFQFTLLDANTYPRLLYNRMPDGGIGEVWINGVFQYEIDFYSPVERAQQVLPLTIPAGTQFPAVVEVRRTGRRTRGSTGTYIYVDAIVTTTPGTSGFNLPIVGSGIQNGDLRLQPFGATWTTTPASTTMFPSGGSIITTIQNSGGVRFILRDTLPPDEVGFMFVTSMSANRGVAEVWVNGRLCTGCGTINTYNAMTFWQVPFSVVIPTGLPGQTEDFGPGPYYVEVRTTNVRSVGARGFGLSVDEIAPLFGSAIVSDADPLWDNIFSEFTPIVGGFDGVWTNVTTPFALDGSYRRTTVGGHFYEFETATDEVVVLRNTSRLGGIAEIWIFDAAAADYRLCFECGTIDSYSSYTRYQVPFYFQIPARFGGGPWLVKITNTAVRSAGSVGNYLELDGFIALP